MREAEELLSQRLGANVVIVTDTRFIQQMLNGKGVTCWGAGQELEDDWIQLATESPQCRGDLQTIFVCQKSLCAESLSSKQTD
jgi:hypothetical protein